MSKSSKSKHNSKNTSSKNSSKKNSNKYTYDRFRPNRPVDIVNIIYLIFMTSLFSLYMHNKYFDITGSRGKIFSNVTIIYMVLAVVAFVLEIFMMEYYQPELSAKDLFYSGTKWYLTPELWAGLFGVANLFAWFMSPDKKGSWDGSTGRFMGLSFMLVLVISFVLVARETPIQWPVLISLFGTSVLCFITAILQHFGNDPFHFKERMKESQREMFISFFGNINTYGSYICVVLPIFVALFIFSKKMWVRWIAGVGLFFAGMGIIPAKSDNVYLGVGVAYIVILYIAIYYKQLTEFVFSVLILGFGLLVMAYANDILSGSQKHINGIAQIVENPKIMTLFVGLIIVVAGLLMFFRGVNYEMYKKIQSKQLLYIITGVGLVLAVAVVILGVRSGNEIFVFNDKWGTYRGYIWRRSWDVFKDGTAAQKIFGHGNETIAYNMKQYHDEMVSITKKTYDNAHCEFLQYIVTTGLFGAITYYAMAATSFAYIIKRMKGDGIAIACLVGSIGYLMQGLVNLNQPITTPYFFVLLAAGVGYIRFRDQRAEEDEEA